MQKLLQSLLNEKLVRYELIITADKVTSTDARFDINDLSLGNNYKPIYTYFVNAVGETIRRNYNKGERRNSNQIMPGLAFQIF